MESLKVVFEKEYKDNKVGDVVVYEGRANVTFANWLLANGLAVAYDSKAKTSGCADCDEKHEKEVAELKAEIERLNSIINEGSDKKHRGKQKQEQSETEE